MLGPVVKAQLVAFLTKKLLDSPLFVRSVQRLHGSFSQAQETAYESLLQATEKAEREAQARASPQTPRSTIDEHVRQRHAYDERHRPRPDQPVAKQNDELLKFIERTKRDLQQQQQQQQRSNTQAGERSGQDKSTKR